MNIIYDYIGTVNPEMSDQELEKLLISVFGVDAVKEFFEAFNSLPVVD